MARSTARPSARGSTTPVDRRRARALLKALRDAHPDATCALEHRDPYQLVVATVLSAQCTDERVNQVTPLLFQRCPDPAALAAIPETELQTLIHSTGFFRAKARNLLGLARTVIRRFQGQVPDRMEDLLTLPGVARKTANVVLGVAFGKAEGVVVDTHVKRLARRLGLTSHEAPPKIEQDLMRLFPREDWIDLSHVLIFHGRRFCMARKPRCDECPVQRRCPSASSLPGKTRN
jgi:endonuclease III